APLSRSSALLPYTTLFRSSLRHSEHGRPAAGERSVFEWIVVADDVIEFAVDGCAVFSRQFVESRRQRCARSQAVVIPGRRDDVRDRKSTRLNSIHLGISYA